MANNSNRKAIEFMVQGVLPPHSTNVLWMDTHKKDNPALKTFLNGAWTYVRTVPEQEFYDELEKKVDVDTFNDTINTVENSVTKVNGELEDLSEDVAVNSTSIVKLKDTVNNLRVIKQEIVESLEDITDPNIYTIYLIEDESGEFYNAYIYIEETESFSLLGANETPVINITNLNSDLNSYITPGLYNVVLTTSAPPPISEERVTPLLLLVEYINERRYPRRIIQYKQTLYDGWRIRSRAVPANSSGEISGEWSEWVINGIAYSSDIEDERTARNVAIETAKNEIKEELLPLIYAGL